MSGWCNTSYPIVFNLTFKQRLSLVRCQPAYIDSEDFDVSTGTLISVLQSLFRVALHTLLSLAVLSYCVAQYTCRVYTIFSGSTDIHVVLRKGH